jgi:hypothetical protein
MPFSKLWKFPFLGADRDVEQEPFVPNNDAAPAETLNNVSLTCLTCLTHLTGITSLTLGRLKQIILKTTSYDWRCLEILVNQS